MFVLSYSSSLKQSTDESDLTLYVAILNIGTQVFFAASTSIPFLPLRYMNPQVLGTFQLSL